MSRKLMMLLVAITMMIAPLTASAKGFGGGHSSKSFGSSYSSSSSGYRSNSYSGVSNSQTYHSGYRSPSANVSGNRTYSTNSPSNSAWKSSGGFMSHALSFGAGAFLGSMFHPFGGSYGGYASHSFSIFGLLIDLLLIYIAFKVIRRLFLK